MPIGPATLRLTAGEGACPPEDCGGPPGYARLLEVLADPRHEEYEDLLDWLGGPWDPEAFDLDATDTLLELYGDAARRHG